MLRVLLSIVLVPLAVVALAVAGFGVYAAIGWYADVHLDGTLSGMPVRAPVVVLRDGRGIPHVRAESMHDLMVAQGYLEGADRLFQIDLLRHHVYGRIAEWFGKLAIEHDRVAREFDVKHVIEAEYAALSPRERADVDAFAEGVNAAMKHEPLPLEYRLLFLRPEPWKSQDSLAAGLATVLDLIDPWQDIIERDRVYRRFGEDGLAGLYSITDPRYDAPTTGAPPAPVPSLPPLPGDRSPLGTGALGDRDAQGSNEWAAGAQHTVSARALLANDPHLTIRIPGVWYLIDLEAPGMHVAGASLAGTPGVILGHNEHLAWGATNGNVIGNSVYQAGRPLHRRAEIIHVRFHSDVKESYVEDLHGFIVDGSYAVDWAPVHDPTSPLETFGSLDRAATIEDALAALRGYPGPTQNFAIADDTGRAAYHLAGIIPDDPLWGLRVHEASDPSYVPVPFERLPHVDPSRNAVVFTANARTYGKGYPYRLSAWFAPPYRAARIAQLLQARTQYDVDYFVRMQNDTLSLVEQELSAMTVAAVRRRGVEHDPQLAPLLTELTQWNGRFNPNSRGASIAYSLRVHALRRFIAGFFSPDEAAAYDTSSDVGVVALRALRERQSSYFLRDDPDGFLIDSLRDVAAQGPPRDWKDDGASRVPHPFAVLGIHWFDGTKLPGDGDAYSLHVQRQIASQSFRAVWDVGNWDAGGIVIPTGESGRPGSTRYDNSHLTWVAQTLVPLPFSRQAVDAAARHRLVLTH